MNPEIDLDSQGFTRVATVHEEVSSPRGLSDFVAAGMSIPKFPLFRGRFNI
jgi:hypothetical protein